MPDLHDLPTHDEVHGGLDCMKPSHSDTQLPQKMLCKRYGFELMCLFTIGNRNAAVMQLKNLEF